MSEKSTGLAASARRALVVLYVVVQVAFAGTDGAVGYAGDWLRMLLLGVEAYLFTAAGTVS